MALSIPLLAHAGLSLDEAIVRHRMLGDAANDDRRLPMPSTPQLGMGDALTVGVFGPTDTMPPLLRPTIAGAGGAAVSFSGGDPDGYAWRLGAQWANRDAYAFSLDGSEVSMKLGPGRAYVSDQRRHWGPSWAGSLTLEAGAAPLPTIGWRKTDATPFASRWLAWLGPWNVDVFLGSLTGHAQPAHPRLVGARLQVMPLDGLEI